VLELSRLPVPFLNSAFQSRQKSSETIIRHVLYRVDNHFLLVARMMMMALISWMKSLFTLRFGIHRPVHECKTRTQKCPKSKAMSSSTHLLKSIGADALRFTLCPWPAAENKAATNRLSLSKILPPNLWQCRIFSE